MEHKRQNEKLSQFTNSIILNTANKCSVLQLNQYNHFYGFKLKIDKILTLLTGPYHSEFNNDKFLQRSVLNYIILIYHRSKTKIKLLFIPSTKHMNMETL